MIERLKLLEELLNLKEINLKTLLSDYQETLKLLSSSIELDKHTLILRKLEILKRMEK